MATEPFQVVGKSIKRKEDPRFLQGRGTYVEDITLPNMVYMVLVRSPYAHPRILGINKDAALATPGVLAVITGDDLVPLGLHWMPTLAGDKQMVLATGKVLFQFQEVAAVIAESRAAACDGAAAVEVDYDPLEVVVDPKKALAGEGPILREDREQKSNRIWTWEAGDSAAASALLDQAEVRISEEIVFPRCHASPLETCGAIADMNKHTGRLTLYVTSQAPHAYRTVLALVAKLPEHMIRVVSPDIGGGFGAKVGVYPGYVVAVVASIVTGRPVKWIESRTEHLTSTAFARLPHEGGDRGHVDGKLKGLRVYTVADHGAFDAQANPTKFPAGLFSICTGSYEFESAYVRVDAAFTNKPPGGVSYRCSFRVTEASYLIERAMDILAQELKMDPVALRRKNLLRAEQFPYESPLGWTYDSGDYHTTLDKALQLIGYDDLRREQAAKRARWRVDGHWRLLLHGDCRGRPQQTL